MTGPAHDSFKTEYHPKSGHETVTESFSDFSHSHSTTQPIVDDKPWQPFVTSGDFEFSEIAHHAALSKEQTDKLLALIRRIANGEAKLTLMSHGDLVKAWTCASILMTSCEKHTVPVHHKKRDLEFEVHFRPLWDWAMDLLQDPLLAPHFTWDAQRLYKHNGTRFERFIDEPWTADRWWNVQSDLPRDSVPFAFILYADKSHLSSSGKAKAYPVIVHCGNLLVDIRNGNGISGGRLVGWLPIVGEDAEEDGKLSFTNLKRVVWHEAFLKLLDSIILLSKTGFSHKCFDDIMRWLFLIILILSADYEEQCVMALIRGLGSHCPCPICHVPANQLYDHSTTHPNRRSEEAIACFELHKKSRTQADIPMKEQSWQPVENAFWHVNRSCPHVILSFNVLHFNNLGMWGSHLFVELKKLLKELGRHAEKTVDSQHKMFPRWRNFSHLKNVTKVTYSDGNKLSDIAKQILFTCQNVLTREDSPIGYALLKCIASYLQYHMYIVLDVQTESTLAAGEMALLDFHQHLKEYIAMHDPGVPRKNWNFPKAHLGKHTFRDILEKGAVRNFSIRPNESHHGPIRRFYLLQTNRKNVAEQILKLDHRSLVCKLIRSCIEHVKREHLKQVFDRQALEDDESETMDDVPFVGHIYLGSPVSPAGTFSAIEERSPSQCVFQDFRKKFTYFINDFLPANNIPLPQGRSWFRPPADKMLQEFRYLKVNYESTATWKLETNYLQCNPSFHGHPRYDCMLIHTHDQHGDQREKFAIVRLHFMFRYTVGGHTLELALVNGDFFLVDYVDSDWFLRAKQLTL
ncbi:hypothetical protein BU15DRAFT_85700 [Melanogaster broomeanus]|nr:hypothetical protein BU15DRAFT_85700 [Melanogaster broomeanus]